MKLKELLAPLDVRELHADPELDITGISYDSRTTQPGELFVAVTGFAARRAQIHPQGRGARRSRDPLRAGAGGGRSVCCGRARRGWQLALVSAAWFGHPAIT